MKITKEDRLAVNKHLKKSNKEIAEALGVNITRVVSIKHKYGIRKNRTWTDDDLDWLKDFVNLKLEDKAEYFGVSKKAMDRVLGRYGLRKYKKEKVSK